MESRDLSRAMWVEDGKLTKKEAKDKSEEKALSRKERGDTCTHALEKEEAMHEPPCNCQLHSARGGSVEVARIQRELIRSYYWSGSCLKDYVFFVCQWHPLLGMCFSHPAHPWNKCERFLTFVLSLCLTVLPVELLLHEIEGNTELEKHSFWITLTMVTFPVMIFESLLYWISIGDIFCKGKGCCCDALSKVFQCFKNCCLCFSVVLALAIAASSYQLAKQYGLRGRDLIRPTLLSRTQSWILWFPINLFVPIIGFLPVWCMEARQTPEERDAYDDDDELDEELAMESQDEE